MDVLQAYIDDSGSTNESEVFVLAGFVARASRWAAFSVEWESVCAQDPKTPDFKMARAERLHGGYWGDGSVEELADRRDRRVNELCGVIKRHALIRVSAGMGWKAYTDIARGKVPSKVDSPYFFLFLNLIMSVAGWQIRTGAKERVDFVFDDQAKIGRISVKWHDYVRELLPPDARHILTSTPSFQHDTEVLPLKAADMMAWHMRRDVADKTKPGANTNHQRRSVLSSLLEVPAVSDNVDARKLLRIVTELQNLGQ